VAASWQKRGFSRRLSGIRVASPVSCAIVAFQNCRTSSYWAADQYRSSTSARLWQPPRSVGKTYDGSAIVVVVSNHGGRQLDCVAASLRALPEVVAAVNGRAEVLMDGGIRRGADIVKAICLGARAVLCGRAYAYGMAVSGEAGVRRALEMSHAPAVGVRFDRRVGSFVRERTSELVSRLNAGRKTHLPQRTASPTSVKQVASLRFENTSQTACLTDNSWNIYARHDQAV
jgi:FMN-dependent dehydrogenase